jgi:Secretion system C-terminal sorting domain/Fibronectin type III domain
MKKLLLLSLIIFSVEASSQCPQPDYLVAQPTAVNTIGLSWNANTGISPQLTEVQMVIWEGEDEDEVVSTFTTTQNPYTMTGVAGTPYRFRVRNLCAGGATSAWSNYARVTPGCEKTAPYYENFDTIEEDWAGDYNGCWRYVTSGEFSEWGQAYADNDGLSSQPYFFMMTEGEWLISPALLDMDSNKKLRFYLRTEYFTALTDMAPEPMIVGTITIRDDLSTFVPYQEVYTEDTPYGREVEVDFSGYTGEAKYIAIKHPVTQVSATYSYIDDILYFDSATCPPPFNASVIENTDTTATIGWEDQEEVDSYLIEYGPHGFTPGTGTVLTGTGTEKQITGLASGTEYDYYIRSACGSGFSDLVVGPRTFSTTCPAQSLPWVEKFNDLDQYGIDAIPDCFRLFNGSVNVYDEPFNYADSPTIVTGTDDTTFLRKNGSATLIYFTPTFDFVAGTTYSFTYKARTIGWNGTSISCMTGRGNKYYNMNIAFPYLNGFDSWQYSDIKYIFTPVISGTYSYMFAMGDTYNELIIDDLEVDEGYTSVIDLNNILFEFDGPLPLSVILEGTAIVYPVQNDFVYMPAPSTDAPWAIVGSGRSPLTATPANVWEANENFITKINTKVDASAMEELHMSFDLLQTFNNVSSESMFRVIVNGEMLGDEIMPQTQIDDEYQTLNFDLTPYVGGDIRISLQHIGRGSNEDEGTGDDAYVDNLRFSSALGTGDPVSPDHIMIYPNPVKNTLTLEGLPEGSDVEIITLAGQVIMKEKAEGPVSQIDMGNYASGMYFVKIGNEMIQKTYKIVKQ